MTKQLLRSLAAIALVATGCPGRAQAPDWQTALAVSTGSDFSEVRATATDAAGNVYVAGNFSGTMQLGSSTLTSAGSASGYDEIFVAKWSSASRSFAWALRAGGADIDFPNAIAVSGGSVYVAGAFNSSTADFGSVTLTNTSTGPQRSANLFVWKLADAGTSASTTWALRATGGAQALALAGSSLYVGGLFAGTTQLGATTLTSAGGSDAWIARLTDAGSAAAFAWAVRGGGPGDDELDGLAVQGNDVYAAGDFENTAAFGNLSLSSAGQRDAFVIKLTDAGSYVWGQRAGGTGGEYVRGLAVQAGSVYVAGEFASPTAAFGSTVLANAGSTGIDGFVAKLTDAGSTGAYAWAQRLGSTGYESLTALLVRGSSVYVGGHFDGTTALIGSTTLANGGASGTQDVYVARLLDAGSTSSFVWARRAGSPGNDYLRTLGASGTTLYAGGSAGLPATFGSQTLAGPASSRASFLATITDQALPAQPPAASLPGLAVFPNPAHGAATLRMPAGAGPATVQVLDALGRVLHRAEAPAGQDYPLVLTGLAPGLYAVRVQAGGASTVQHLTVE